MKKKQAAIDPKTPVVLIGYQTPESAAEIASLLDAEGITCFLQNLFSNTVLVGGYVDGGVRIEVAYADYERAVKVLLSHGIHIPDETETPTGRFTGWVQRIPFMTNYPLEKRLWALFILVIVGLILLALMLDFSGSITKS